MQYFLNEWCSFTADGDVTVNNYPHHFLHTTYIDALKQQARDIYDNTGINTIFISGGIDSHTKALAYISAGIPCKIVFVKNTYNGNSNNRELFYARQFCQRYNQQLHIFQVDYDKDSLRQLLENKNYFTTSVGLGNTLQYDAMEKYMALYDEKIIVGQGGFDMIRSGNQCSGRFLKPNFGFMCGIDVERILLFDVYAPHVFKYYEFTHRTTPEIQICKSYGAKNLSYTELGMPLRAKLATWEFLDLHNDYSELTTIDYRDDHSPRARLTASFDIIKNIFGLTEDEIKKIRQDKSYSKTDSSRNLYTFISDQDFNI